MLADLPRRREVVLLAVLFEGGLGVLALGLGWWIDCPPWRSLHWDGRAAVFAVVATVPLLCMFLLCVAWPIGPLGRIKTVADEIIKPLFRPCTLLDLAVLSLLAGLGEEMLFRGVLQDVLGRWVDPWLALSAVSVLFGLLHAITPGYAVLATLMGAYLGGLFLWSDNLLIPVLAHALYDFLALAYLVRRS